MPSTSGLGEGQKKKRAQGMKKQEDTSNVLLLTQLLNNPEENGMPLRRCLEKLFPWAMATALINI